MSEYLKHRLALKNGLVKPCEKKKPIPIAKRSVKMKEIFKGYKKQVKAFLSKPENLRCKIQMQGCTNIAECVHHVSGRIGDKLTDEKYWMPSCQSCNLWVEVNDGEARDKGFKKTRMGKVNK